MGYHVQHQCYTEGVHVRFEATKCIVFSLQFCISVCCWSVLPLVPASSSYTLIHLGSSNRIQPNLGVRWPFFLVDKYATQRVGVSFIEIFCFNCAYDSQYCPVALSSVYTLLVPLP